MATDSESKPRRRYDPMRRERIIDACLEVIAEFGVDGTSFRKVAARADVPLGSITYHFVDREDLLFSAFMTYSLQMSGRLDNRLDVTNIDNVSKLDMAAEKVAEYVSAEVFASREDLVLTLELYTLAARNLRFRQITNEWMARSRASLEEYFDPTTARLIDAFGEGITIHRALDIEPVGEEIASIGLQRIISNK